MSLTKPVFVLAIVLGGTVATTIPQAQPLLNMMMAAGRAAERRSKMQEGLKTGISHKRHNITLPKARTAVLAA